MTGPNLYIEALDRDIRNWTDLLATAKGLLGIERRRIRQNPERVARLEGQIRSLTEDISTAVSERDLELAGAREH